MPRIVIADAELVTTDQMARMSARIEAFIKDHVAHVLAPLLALENPVVPQSKSKSPNQTR